MFRVRLAPLSRLDAGSLAAFRWVALAGVGLAMFLVYLFGLVNRYSIDVIGMNPAITIAGLTRGQPVAQLDLTLTYVLLGLLYYLAWRLCRGARGRQMWLTLLTSLAVINLAMVSLYPVGAADVFDYIAHGRVISVWHGNPYYLSSGTHPQDPIVPYAAWTSFTTSYGPAWEILGAGVTRLAGDDLVANVLAFKALDLIFYAGCLALVAALLRRDSPDQALAGVCLFGLNPLVIYETAGNGHNDVVMVFWMLGAMLAISRDRHTLAALALTVGALIKFIPLLLLPICVAYSLGQLYNWRARLRFLIVAGLACGLLAAAVTALFWRGGDMVVIQRHTTMLTTSLPAVIQVALQPLLGVTPSQQLVSAAALGLTTAAVLAAAWAVWQRRRITPVQGSSWRVAARASTVVLLFYLLLACLWFQGWYAIWPLSLAAVLPEGALATSAVLLTFAGIWKPIFFDFFLDPTPALPPRDWRETRLGPAVLGLSWVYALVAIARAWWATDRDKRLGPLALRSRSG